MISGDKAKMELDVATNMGNKTSLQEILILKHDTEPLVMGSINSMAFVTSWG